MNDFFVIFYTYGQTEKKVVVPIFLQNKHIIHQCITRLEILSPNIKLAKLKLQICDCRLSRIGFNKPFSLIVKGLKSIILFTMFFA